MAPTLGNGKICYIQIPATDIQLSANFYQKVFGWRIRQQDNGHTSFDDGVHEVSGTWVLGLPPSTQPSVLIYIMVDDISATMEAIVAHGGAIVQPVGADAPEITARFSDVAGNVFGIFQERTLGPGS